VAWPELPKRVLYALKSLCFLAAAQGPVCAREVARCTGMPPAEASKILYLLGWGGFVSSRRGSKGGFWLRRTPGRIRIGDVVKFLSSPPEPGGGRHDPVVQVWEQIAASSHDAFNRISLDDLLKEGKRLEYASADHASREPMSLSEEKTCKKPL
jgi:Rrf2 family transcriptional regulator, iron-sulfur cluster assembly transcription factor